MDNDSRTQKSLKNIFSSFYTYFLNIILQFLNRTIFLSFAAGAMIYVVSSELIPEAQAEKKSNLVTISVGVGFVIMMLLDVALG